MTDKYVLYLDESIDDKQFAIAGFAINENQLNSLSEKILDLKKQIWDEATIESCTPILHSTQLNHVYKNRSNPKRTKLFSGPYSILAAKTKEEIQKNFDTVYGRLSKIIKDLNITTFCCFVDLQKIKKIYKTGTPLLTIEDKYDIAIQELIECYCHFLHSVDGVGSIIYESRNDALTWNEKSPDAMMLLNFCKAKANNKGISIFPDIEKNKRLIHFYSQRKKADNAGLQLADFIAYNYCKLQKRVENGSSLSDFQKSIWKQTYNGNAKIEDTDLRTYWGMRSIPLDPTELYTCKTEKLKIKKALDNCKAELKKKERKNAQLLNEKRQLLEKTIKLEEKIAELEKPPQK